MLHNGSIYIVQHVFIFAVNGRSHQERHESFD